MKYSSLITLVFAISSSYISAQTTVSLAAEKDNTIYEEDGNLSNGIGLYFIAGLTNNGDSRRGLLQYDLSTIPAGVTITNVNLKTYCYRTKDPASSAPVQMHRVLQDWGETTSTVPSKEGKGTSASPGDATWTDNFFGASAWTTAGGDYVPSISATVTATDDSPVDWSSSQMITDVQGWLDGTAPNHGWIFIGDEMSNGSVVWFYSRQGTNNPPVLEISYDSSALCNSTTEILQGQISSGTYQASQEVIIDLGTISAGATVVVRAGNCITISPDSEFIGETELSIGPCQ